MGSSAVPTLILDGRNWKVYWASLLKAAATKSWLGILSGQETNDESLQWDGKDAQLKMLFYQTPEELSVEPPSEERLRDILTEASSKEEAEAAVGAAQQTPSQNVKVEENLPELHEQPSSRAGKPLESEHLEVLNGMVKIPDKVKNVDKMAHEDLPLKLCDRSTTNDLPSGEQALCMSTSTTNSQRSYTKEPQLTIYNPGSTLEWPTASFQKAKTDEGEHRGMKGHYMDTKNVKSAA
ncbi:hypothetical protein EDD16DRAFT_1527966 [Pisolithus croceorrhizus]|nr:hypothetical protein EDD16DRAFT_1527966 [Pisolithus croceorrhizus]